MPPVATGGSGPLALWLRRKQKTYSNRGFRGAEDSLWSQMRKLSLGFCGALMMNTAGRRASASTGLLQLWRMTTVIHLNDCLSKMHTLPCALWEEEEGGAVKRQAERKEEAGWGDHKFCFYWCIGYCFTNLLAQQSWEFNHIMVIKHTAACWHFLKALLSTMLWPNSCSSREPLWSQPSECHLHTCMKRSRTVHRWIIPLVYLSHVDHLRLF